MASGWAAMFQEGCTSHARAHVRPARSIFSNALNYPVALAVLVIGIGIIELLALII
jgi:altronate dehydratase